MDPLLLERAQHELQDQQLKKINITLDARTTVTIIGQLQLALRHPANTGPSADYARFFTAHLIRQLDPPPALKQVIEAGWDPDQDVIVDIPD